MSRLTPHASRLTNFGDWDPDFLKRSPMFEPLAATAQKLRASAWPESSDFNALLSERVQPVSTASGRPLRFVNHERQRVDFEDGYEPRIYLRGEVQYRDRDWHDLFNALVWMTFPLAKSALNARQYRELKRRRESGAANRGRVQDALTLFDEGGLIVAASDPELARLLTDFEWKELFWERRAQVSARMRFFLVGHALYEKALAPYVGVTGRGIIVRVSEAWLAAPIEQQIPHLDAFVAARIGDPLLFSATRELASVPLLGVPGWCNDNENESYYDNAKYFRRRPGAVPVAEPRG